MGLFSRDLRHAGERGIATAASGLCGRDSWRRRAASYGKSAKMRGKDRHRVSCIGTVRAFRLANPSPHAGPSVMPPLSLRCPSVFPPSSLRLRTEGERRDNGGMMEGQWRDQHEEAVAAAARRYKRLSSTPSRRSSVASTLGTYICVSAGRWVAMASNVLAFWRSRTFWTVPSPAL